MSTGAETRSLFQGVVMELTKEDLEFIEESLLYTRKSFEESKLRVQTAATQAG
jgi:hypothetical protein